MRLLKELVRIFNHADNEFIVTLFSFMDADAKLMQLYEAAQQEDVQTDEDAIKILYEEDKNGKSKYSKLKYSFKQRLLNMVLLLEPSSKDEKIEKKRAFFYAYRTYLTGYFLVLLGARNYGISMLEQLLPSLELQEFTILVLETSKLLRQHYAAIEGNIDKAIYYDQYVEKYLAIYSSETKVEGHLHILESYYIHEKANRDKIHELAIGYSFSLNETSLQNSSSRLIYKAGMIEIIKHVSINDYHSAIEVCNTIVRFLKQKSKPDHTGLSIIYAQWIVCASQVGDFEQAKHVSKAAIQHLSIGSFNWFKSMNIMLILALKTKSYEEALAYFKETTTNENFVKLDEATKEEWKIYEVYLYLLALADKLPLASSPQKSFSKIRKFLNEVPNLSKDKSGMNVSILLGYLLSLVAHQKYDELSDKIEGYQKYIQRYLKEDAYARVVTLFKIIFLLPKATFKSSLLRQMIPHYLEQLQHIPNNFLPIDATLEFIPYEELVDLLLIFLDKNENSN